MEKEAMRNLVSAYREAKDIDNGLEKLGFHATPCFNIAGRIADAIYAILGEDTQSFDESITAVTLENTDLSPIECADVFVLEYHKRNGTDKISESVLASLKEAAEQLHITPLAMINVILGEWALHHAMMGTKHPYIIGR